MTEFVFLCIATVFFYTVLVILILPDNMKKKLSRWFFALFSAPGLILILPLLALRIYRTMQRVGDNRFVIIADVFNWTKEDKTRQDVKQLALCFWLCLSIYLMLKFFT